MKHIFHKNPHRLEEETHHFIEPATYTHENSKQNK